MRKLGKMGLDWTFSGWRWWWCWSCRGGGRGLGLSLACLNVFPPFELANSQQLGSGLGWAGLAEVDVLGRAQETPQKSVHLLCAKDVSMSGICFLYKGVVLCWLFVQYV
jgi:hypothetical protein